MVVEYKRYKREAPAGWSDAWMTDVIQCGFFKVRDFEEVCRGVAGLKATCEARGWVQEAQNLAWVIELLRVAHPTHLPGISERLHEPEPASDSDGEEQHCGVCCGPLACRSGIVVCTGFKQVHAHSKSLVDS